MYVIKSTDYPDFISDVACAGGLLVTYYAIQGSAFEAWAVANNGVTHVDLSLKSATLPHRFLEDFPFAIELEMAVFKINRGKRQIVLGGGGVVDPPDPPSEFPGDVATDSFQASASTQPWYAGSTQYHAAHYNGRTYFVWENYDRANDKRYTSCRAYTHATQTWGRVWAVGRNTEPEDDDHGVPAICFNADGRGCVIYGNHDGNQRLAVMTNPEDETNWTTIDEAFVGEYTYPHPILIGTTIYVLFREDHPAGVEFPAGAKVLIYRPVTFSGATATVGAAVRIGDLGDNSRWYQGNHLLVSGNRIAQCCARADYNDTQRRNTYYYEIDITNARLQAFDGTTSPFPVVGATMDSTFKVHDSGAFDQGAASHVVDSLGRTHLVFTKGTATHPNVFHMIGSSGSFTTPVAIAEVTNGSDLADLPRLIHESGNTLGVYYNRDPSNLWGRGGNVYRKTLPEGGSSGSWSDETTILVADGTRHALGQVGNIFNAHADARIVFTEVAQAPGDENCFPSKRQFVIGDSGFIPQTQPIGVAPIISGPGVWLDPSDITSLWSDLTRTTPAVVDGPVRVIDDKSGNGYHLSLEGSEPGVLRFDDGVYWIDFGDEFSPTTSYSNAAVAVVVNNAYWACLGYRDHETTAGATIPMCLDDDGSNRVFQFIKDSTTGGSVTNVLRVTGFGSPSANLSTGVGVVRNNDDIVQGIHVTGPTCTAYWNGNQFSQLSATTNPASGATRLRIGANTSQSSTSWLEGRFYGAIIRSGDIPLATRQQDMQYLRSRMPR